MKKILALIVLIFCVIISGLLYHFTTGSEISHLSVNASPCYFSEGEPKIDLNISWRNPKRDEYRIVFDNEKIPIQAKNLNNNKYFSSLSLKLDECPVGANKTFPLLVGLKSKNVYYGSNITISYPTERKYNYSLYLCTYDYYGTFEEDECFVPSKKVNSRRKINIHGGYINGSDVPWLNLFVVFKACENCDIPKYMELETSTLSHTKCSIKTSVDPNNIDRYNKIIYHPETEEGITKTLKVKDTIRIPVEKYIKKNITSFKITPEPNGCNLRINFFRIRY